jgi:hypothetical protein
MIFVGNNIMVNDLYPNVYAAEYDSIEQFSLLEFPDEIGITVLPAIGDETEVRYWFKRGVKGDLFIEFEEWFSSAKDTAQF